MILACSACTRFSDGFLVPQGPVAGAERDLFYVVLALTLLVIIPVFVLTPWLVWRYRHNTRSKARYEPDWVFSWPLECLAWGVPVVIIAALGSFAWWGAHQLDPYRPLKTTQSALQIQVVGLDWKWLFIYPDQHIASLNQLAIPVRRPVHLTVTTDTVMQSLMIPRLAGQIYAMAGMQSQLYIQADHVGQYRGENTQYNGKGFHAQKFQTLALSDQKFTDWVSSAERSTHRLDCPTYAELASHNSVDKPRVYGNVQPNLFAWIVAKYRIHPVPACAREHDENPHG